MIHNVKEIIQTRSIISSQLTLPQSLVSVHPRGYFQIRRSGGLDLTSSLEPKFGARSGQDHQIRGKIWEVLSPQDAKLGKSPNFGIISEIQSAKFGVFVTHIF